MAEAAESGSGSRRAQKSPDAFRTISEVASELDVPQHVLRFWESKFSHVRPLKRAGGRRYYRPEDVLLLRKIRALLYSDGYTIKGVQKLLRENGVRSVLEGNGEDYRAEPHLPEKQAVFREPAASTETASRSHHLQQALVELTEAKSLLKKLNS